MQNFPNPQGNNFLTREMFIFCLISLLIKRGRSVIGKQGNRVQIFFFFVI